MKVNRVYELRKRNERFSSPCAVEVPNVSSVITQLQKLRSLQGLFSTL